MSSSPDAINMWVVCKNPRDYPGQYTARRSVITRGGIVKTSDLLLAFSLETVRQLVRSRAEQMGYLRLDRLERQEEDDPVIVEAWI